MNVNITMNIKLTDQELDSINEQVAKALGWNVVSLPYGGRSWTQGDTTLEKPPNYSRSIEAAWEILKEDDIFWSINREFDGIYVNLNGVREMADTAPLAICKAFLKLKTLNP